MGDLYIFSFFLPKKFKKSAKFKSENIDLIPTFLYNIGMETDMKTSMKTDWKIWTVRIVLTLLCALVYVWIFSNSLKTGEQSSSQSQAVTDAVQDAVGVIAPDSNIANATGEEYQKLHNAIRTLAHFSEFLLLGFLLACCCFSYTRVKKWFLVPLSLVIVTPVIDEFLQTLTKDRAMEFIDVIVDMVGGFLGFALALSMITLILYLYKNKQKKENAA